MKLLFAILGFVSTTAFGNVLVVSPVGGSGVFTSIQAAIDAATDGDIVLLRPGSYLELSVVITNKALTVIGDPAGAATLWPSLTVQNLTAGKTVVLRGFQLGMPSSGGFGSFPGSLTLSNDSGAVWIEDFTSIGGPNQGFGTTTNPGSPAVSIDHCAATTFARCTLLGGHGANEFVAGPIGSYGPGDGGVAARITGNSRAAFHHCQLVGGDGGSGSLFHGANGGAAIDVKASTVLASGCSLVGGKGGTACAPAQIPAFANGGPGIVVDASSLLQRQDTTTAGGAPGSDNAGNPGLPGPTVSGSSASIVDLIGPARGMSVTSPVREQQSTTLTIEGEPNDFVAFFMGFNGTSLSLPPNHGWLLVGGGPSLGPFVIGALLGPSGDLSLNLTAPDLVPPALLGQQFLLQPVFQHSLGYSFGAPTAFVLIDSTL